MLEECQPWTMVDCSSLVPFEISLKYPPISQVLRMETRGFFYFREARQCETSLCRPGIFNWLKNQTWTYSPLIGTWSYGFDAQILTLFMTKKVIPLILSFTLSFSYYIVRLKHLNVRAHQIVVWLHERLGNISLVNLMYRIITRTLFHWKKYAMKM